MREVHEQWFGAKSGVNAKEPKFLHESREVLVKKGQWGVIRMSAIPLTRGQARAEWMGRYLKPRGKTVTLPGETNIQNILTSSQVWEQTGFISSMDSCQFISWEGRYDKCSWVKKHEVTQKCQIRLTQIIMVKALHNKKKNGKKKTHEEPMTGSCLFILGKKQ